MADLPQKKHIAPEEQQDWRRIRITLTSRDVKPLEEVTSRLVSKARSEQLTVKGPVRLPTKRLRITTRKSPCGEGTNTWDRWQMRIHKRLLDLHSPPHMVREITKIKIEPGVEVEVTIQDVLG
eukprot:CAMPEP_0202688234 /NCGR_PEP_ID=MMETSP1385-20130828/3769_1 /ASSEMBLY_ACC=CAM_ASM_000861 /TAXON_ID=933848 /ORGANISM="Elphidium margaritaceum" /LENGTH=122 /DNA_ID=CAMNT_0049343157 /DNA_START=151 /DNA_END=519 /DNA_ORIENTATION=-